MAYTIVRTEEYLAHEGIKGMKWGVRNGPPYPLPPAVAKSVVKKAATEAKPIAKAAVKKGAANAKKQGANTFKNVAIQQASQKAVNKAVGKDKKEESFSDIAKTIAKGAAIAAATTMLSSFLVSGSDQAIKLGKAAVKKAMEEQLLDKLLAQYYGWY